MRVVKILLALNLAVILALGVAPGAIAAGKKLLAAPKIEKRSYKKLKKDHVEFDRVVYSDGLDCVSASKIEGGDYADNPVTTSVALQCNWDSIQPR